MKTHNTSTTAAVVLTALILLAAVFPAMAFAEENIPVKIDITLTYIVNGSEEAAGGDTFTLVPDDPRAPMPEDSDGGEKTITIRKEGSYSFGYMYFEGPGVWWYTISRDITDKKGVTKDDSVYRVKVIALNDGHGYVLAYLDGSDEKHELVYTDRVAPKTPKTPETGDHSSWLTWSATALAAASALAAIAIVRRRNKKGEVQYEQEKHTR